MKAAQTFSALAAQVTQPHWSDCPLLQKHAAYWQITTWSFQKAPTHQEPVTADSWGKAHSCRLWPHHNQHPIQPGDIQGPVDLSTQLRSCLVTLLPADGHMV